MTCAPRGIRAGLAPFGSHRLRHALACDMVRGWVPLQEIGQVSSARRRHQHQHLTPALMSTICGPLRGRGRWGGNSA